MPDRKLLLPAFVTALLVLGISGTTQARWSDSGTITGTAIHTGRLDLTVDGQDAVGGYAALGVSDLVPGGSSAGVLTIGNAGDVPLDYAVSLTGSNADGKGLAAALVTTVTDADTTTGSTCGGTPLAAVTTLAPGATDRICVQVQLPGTAPASLAGAASDLTVTVDGDVNHAWTDHVAVTGSHLTTVTPTAPVLSCGPAALGSITLGWTAVPGATAYRVHSGLLGNTVQDVPATQTSITFTGVSGTASVQAIFGSTTWISPSSATLSYSALTGVLGSCS